MTALNPPEAAILGLLHAGPKTGGDLCAMLAAVASVYNTTRSQVYRELPRLAEQGYVRAEQPGPRGSQPWRITARGRKAYTGWVNDLTVEHHLRNPVALVYALADVTGYDGASGLHAAAQDWHGDQIRTLTDRIAEASEADAGSLVNALRLALSYHYIALEWLVDLAEPDEVAA